MHTFDEEIHKETPVVLPVRAGGIMDTPALDLIMSYLSRSLGGFTCTSLHLNLRFFDEDNFREELKSLDPLVARQCEAVISSMDCLILFSSASTLQVDVKTMQFSGDTDVLVIQKGKGDPITLKPNPGCGSA